MLPPVKWVGNCQVVSTLISVVCQSKKNRTDPPSPQRLEIAESETVVAKTELHLALKRIEDFQVSDASKFFIEES